MNMGSKGWIFWIGAAVAIGIMVIGAGTEFGLFTAIMGN